MARTNSKKADYAVNKSKRKRAARSPKHKKDGRFQFREAMTRSLEELELGGYLPSFKELQELFMDEKKAVQFLMDKNIIDVPKICPRCTFAVKIDRQNTARCRRPDCAYKCPKSCQRCGSSDSFKATLDSDGEETKADCDACKWQWRPGTEFQRSIFRESFVQECHLPKNEALHCLWL